MKGAVVPIRPYMIAKVAGGHALREPFDPSKRGFAIVYRGAHTPCPGCGRNHWMVGRVTAECCFCATALPLEGASSR
jgi:hypothetical protein